MAKSGRNRSEGWSHAKSDGHANENKFAKELAQNQDFISEVESYLGATSLDGPPVVAVDGSKHVKSIFDDSTTSKVDLEISWNSGENVKVSLKKSTQGQVWLVSVPRFISAMEFYLGKILSDNVKDGISLFIGGTNLANCASVYDKALAVSQKKTPKIAAQELHQSRLVGSTIEMNLPDVWSETIDFFNTNIGLITRLSFSQGLAKSPDDAAEIIVYNNADPNPAVFSIASIVEKAERQVMIFPIAYGPRNGGSTIQLPTGFLQMHHPDTENLLQFHHKYEKISKL